MAAQAVRSLSMGSGSRCMSAATGFRVVYTNSAVILGPVIGARLAGVPAIVHARELPPDGPRAHCSPFIGILANTVIAVSSPVETRLPEPTCQGGDDPRRNPNPADATATRLCLSLVPTTVLIGTVGGDWRKGQDIAIDAVACLAAEGVEARLKLVGPIHDETDARNLQLRARALGVEVQLTGPPIRLAASSTRVTSCSPAPVKSRWG